MTDLVVLGIAEAAQSGLVRELLRQQPRVDAIRADVENSVYWPAFCGLAAMQRVPGNFLPPLLASLVLAWAEHGPVQP